MKVDVVHTPVAMSELVPVLRLQWRALMGAPLRRDVAALLLALVDVEQGAGGAVKNWNLGNIVALDDEHPWFEGIDSGNVRAFRAYPSLNAGAKALVRQLTRPSRKQWRAGLLTGNPEEFVAALGGKRGGPKYFEARFDRYRKAYMTRWQRYGTRAGTSAWGWLLGAAAAAGVVYAYVRR